MSHKTVALIVAAGEGIRCKKDNYALPKQYILLNSKSVFYYTIKNTLSNENISYVQVIIKKDHEHLYIQSVANLAHDKLLPAIYGGNRRQDSVRLGLEAINNIHPDYVVIHDACRPFFSHNIINNALELLRKYTAVVPVLSIVDTIKIIDNNMIVSDADRTVTKIVQTPQAYRYSKILECHRLAYNTNPNKEFTDDSSIMMEYNIPVVTIAGEYENFKITTPEDLIRAKQCLE